MHRTSLPAALVALCAVALTSCATVPAKPKLVKPHSAERVRLACVGDSITFGAGVENREHNSFPAVLSRILRDGYDVRNFGVSGATLLKKGDLPYWSLKQFAELDQFQPNVIVLKLGTNDTKPQNWREGPAAFSADLDALLDHFGAYPTRPQIWVCLPVPVYEDRWGINEHTLVEHIIPALRRAAAARRLPVIDLHTALSGRPDYFPDKIHPNATGAAMIAMSLYAAFKGQ